MFPHRVLSISVCLLAAANAAGAQERLTLDEATARALTKNHAIRIEREATAYFTSLGVGLKQPLLRHRAIDPARAALHVTALDRDRSGAALDRQLQQTAADVESAYWRLVAARRELDVRRSSIALAERQRADTLVRIEARTVAASDLSQTSRSAACRRSSSG